MDDWMTDRRTALKLIASTGITAGLAGCSSDGGDGGGTPGDGNGLDGGTSEDGSNTDGEAGGTPGGQTDESTTTAREDVIEDTFEDGTIAVDPEWELDSDERGAEVSVVDRESPNGGSKAFRIADGKDPHGPEKGLRAELQESAEWSPGAWTLEGQFYVEALPTERNGPPKAFVDVSDVTFSPHWLEDEDNPAINLDSNGASAGVAASTSAPALEAETWYDYQLVHDGDGGYTASRYRLDDGGNRVANVEVSITDEAPLENANAEFEVVGGQGASRTEGEGTIAIEHSYIRWVSDE